MGFRDEIYTLEGEVEIDDGFFETVSITRYRNEKLKRGSPKLTTAFNPEKSRVTE